MVPLLELHNVIKNFGGLRAINNLSLTLEQGEVVGLIGPNGSGKTTLFNLITGFVKMDSGKIVFNGKDITGYPPYKIVAQGIGRTWQLVNPFPNYTTFDNVKISCLVKGRQAENMTKRVIKFLNLTGLNGLQNEKAGNLPIGNLKRLEIARALATEPSLLLLDEPFGGLAHSEIVGLKTLIGELHRKGMTILLVEHVMREILGLVNRLVVLNFGTKLIEGPTYDVLRDENVIEAFLGHSYVEDK